MAEAILKNDLYIITHDEFRNRTEVRANELLAATAQAEFQP